MAEPFKNFIDATLVRQAAGKLRGVDPGFDAVRFVSLATDGLEALELKARALQVCTALEAVLPPDFDAAAALLQHTMQGDDGLRGWILWPVGEYIARHGQDRPALALELLRTLTPRFTAEFAIRPFVERHPGLTYATLARWADDPDEHVRRLVSEGTRPRLPWGRQLKGLIADPGPNLPLLQRLQDDPSDYVRRSVANHLNDIAKDHPARIADWVEAHLPGASTARARLLRHACRTLIKAGDPRILGAFGQGAAFRGEVTFAVSPKRLTLGSDLAIAVVLRSTARRPQSLVIDYAVHHVKAAGHRTAKVFKGWSLELGAGEARTLGKRHAVRPITTRTYHPGRHAVDLRINGRIVAEAGFDLRLDRPTGGVATSATSTPLPSPPRRSRR